MVALEQASPEEIVDIPESICEYITIVVVVVVVELVDVLVLVDVLELVVVVVGNGANSMSM
jgi:hypothetical protein